MDHLDTLRCFVTVADAGGFAVARRLGCSAAAVTRAIAALEVQRLGVLLFQRSTRMVRLTEAGERFLADCRPILSDLHEAEQTASGAQGATAGAAVHHRATDVWHPACGAHRVGLSAGPAARAGAHAVCEPAGAPAGIADMDVAVRIAHLPDSGLTALPVGALRRLVQASPEYLARHGEPQHPQDLAQHRAIAFSFDARAAAPWKFGEGLVGQPQIVDQQCERGGHCRCRGGPGPHALPRLRGGGQPARGTVAHCAGRV